MTPNFVIIGAAKSASSFLQNCLNRHQDVYISPGEVPFFESPDYEQSQISHLTSLFNGRKERVLGIKRPKYIGRAEVPARIRQHLPQAKLIAVLRHPMKRAVAHYYHSVRYGLLPALPLSKGMRLLLEDNSFRASYPAGAEVLECGMYGKYISMYKKLFPQNQLLVMRHDDLVADPLRITNTALVFLGLSELVELESRGERPQQVVYSMLRINILRLANPFLFRYDQTKSRLSRRPSSPLGTAVIRFVGKIDHVLRKLPLREARVPDKTIRKQLADYYRTDTQILSGLTGGSFEDWLGWDA
jgi:hypothetical protein